MDGATVLEKRYGRERWRSSETTSRRAAVKPPEAPPRALPKVPVMLGDAVLAEKVAAALLEEGIYAIGFFFPVVPKGEARIRVQLSAVHEDADIDRAVAAFTRVGKGLGVV